MPNVKVKGVDQLFTQIMSNVKSAISNIDTTRGDSVTGISLIPYIREQDLTFSCANMKPNTRVYPFFDGVDVGDYCTPTGGSLGDALYTDNLGNVSGTFSIPASNTLKFRVGERIFRLIDNQTNDKEMATTFSERIFSAKGINQSVSSDDISSTRKNIYQTSNDSSVVDTFSGNVYDKNVSFNDPLAQTFTVDGNAYPNGCFISSVDLYFSAKDVDVPVSIEIRETVNGFPHSSKIIPFSQVTLSPNSVGISNDASVATKFSFESPVYLPSGDYALVVKSNSENYKTFIAQLGGEVLGKSLRISQQPYSGTLFKSQNATTWQPELTQDLTFKINRCKFDTNTISTAICEAAIPASDVEFDAFTVFNNILVPPKTTFNFYYKKRDKTTGNLDSDWTLTERFGISELLNRANLDSSISDSSFLVKAEMLTSDDAVSPLIDMVGTDLLTIENIINNDSANETNSEGGNAKAVYVTNRVSLDDGFDSDALRVYLTASLPAGTDIKVYARVRNRADQTEFEDLPYVELNRVNKSDISSSTNEYIELEYFLDNITYNGFNEFKDFAIKIVMLSTKTTIVPKINDMRGIALI